MINPSNARAILATSLHFGGMPDLVHHAYTVARDSITVDTISDWVAWASGTVIPPQSESNGYYTSSNGEEAWEEGEGRWYGRYGEYSDRIKQDM